MVSRSVHTKNEGLSYYEDVPQFIGTVSQYKQDVIDKVSRYKESEIDLIVKSIEKAEYWHRNQRRHSTGEPYIIHPMSVAQILIDMKLDYISVVTAILHDTIEDTEATVADIKEHFGNEVATLVQGVTKLTKIQYQSASSKQAENFCKLLFAMSEDLRIILVKLADRLHNMQTLFNCSEHKIKRVSQETLEIYAPIADRIGLQKIKVELQTLAFSKLHPELYQSISKRLNDIKTNEGNKINLIINKLSSCIHPEVAEAKIYGRFKTPYSIWKKMEDKNITFNQLADIIAFRVIVSNIKQCYEVLGIIHQKYKFVPNSLKDYISTPKGNGYKSLHTLIIGSGGSPVEIQIRTEEMHEIASHGIAAHWRYKQRDRYSTSGEEFYWLHDLLSMLENSESPEDFLRHTKIAMYYNQVFCFTPKGKIIALPKGATVIDFAYAVHSDIGDKCISAKINNVIYPPNRELSNGEQVEIICSEEQLPKYNWQDYATTGRAKLRIKSSLKKQQRKKYIDLGQRVARRMFSDLGYDYDEKFLNTVANKLNKDNVQQVYEDIGKGILSVKLLADELQHNNSYHPEQKLLANHSKTTLDIADNLAVQDDNRNVDTYIQQQHQFKLHVILDYNDGNYVALFNCILGHKAKIVAIEVLSSSDYDEYSLYYNEYVITLEVSSKAVLLDIVMALEQRSYIKQINIF